MSYDEGPRLRRGAPVWRPYEDAGDPSLIILHAPVAAPARTGDETPKDDPRDRALLRAGFRSHAEGLLLARMGGGRTTQTPPGAPQAGSPAGGRDAARTPVDRALEEARSVFGTMDPESEGEVRGGLDAMMAQIRESGRRYAEAERRERAFDALEAEIDDLVTRVQGDPDRHADYALLLDRAIGRFEDGLEENALAHVRARAGRELGEVRIGGFIGLGRLDDAREVLAGLRDRLPDGAVAELEHRLAGAERERKRASLGERTVLLGRLHAAISGGQDVSEEIAAAAAEGRLSPPDLRRLQDMAEERDRRERAVTEAIARVETALDEGRALDAAAPDDRAAANLFWSRQLEPRLAGLEPLRRVDIEAHVMATLGIVPDPIMSRMAEALTIGPPPAAVVAAAQLVRTVTLRPELMDSVPARLLQLADHIWQAHASGAAPDLAVAFGRRWLERHATETGTVAPDDPLSQPREHGGGPGMAPGLATIAGSRALGVAMSGPPGIPVRSLAAIPMGTLRTIGQAPGSGNIDRYLDSLPDTSAAMYVRRISGLSERLDPRYRDEFGHAERRRLQEAGAQLYEQLPGTVADFADSLRDAFGLWF